MFTQETFASIGAHSADTPNLYSYKSDDSFETILAADYFADKQHQIEEGDVVNIMAEGRQASFTVNSDKSSLSIVGPDSGWYDYESTDAPQAIVGNEIYHQLLNNALGAQTKNAFRPIGLDAAGVWNPSTNQFDFSQLKIGDQVYMRVDLDIDPANPNQDIDLAINFDIGGQNFVLQVEHIINKSADPILRHIAYVAMYIGSEGTRDNPAEIKIRSDDALTVNVHGWYISILRR